jgi:hypothetical protein
VSDERVEFGKTTVVEQAYEAFARREFATFVLRLYASFTATKMSGFSAGFEIFQLCRRRLIFRCFGIGFGGYRNASLAGDLRRAAPEIFGKSLSTILVSNVMSRSASKS